MRDEDTKEMQQKYYDKKQMGKVPACLILQFYKDFIFNT